MLRSLATETRSRREKIKGFLRVLCGSVAKLRKVSESHIRCEKNESIFRISSRKMLFDFQDKKNTHSLFTGRSWLAHSDEL